MGKIQQFEDLDAWQRALELAEAVYELTERGKFTQAYSLRDQMQRAAVSVMSNIAEGFERGGDKEFRQFLAQAKGSAGELRSHLHIALRARFIVQAEFDRLCRLSATVSRILAGLMKYLQRSPLRGSKYR